VTTFARKLIMADPWRASRFTNAEAIHSGDRQKRLDEWLNSFHPAKAVSLQQTDWSIDHVSYLALFSNF
jgi:hypothetical protein